MRRGVKTVERFVVVRQYLLMILSFFKNDNDTVMGIIRGG